MSGSNAEVYNVTAAEKNQIMKCLTAFAGFMLSQCGQGGKPMTSELLGSMLNIYGTNCLVVNEKSNKPPAGSKCRHIYVKGAKEGTPCNTTANFYGKDGLPKCSNHKRSNPYKAGGSDGAPATGKPAGSFSYIANKGKGRVAPQSLSTMELSLLDGQEPARLDLTQMANGTIYDKATKITFVKKSNGFIATGYLDGEEVKPLTKKHVCICYANRWKWEEPVAQTDSGRFSHTTTVQGEHPLVAAGNEKIGAKIQSVEENSGQPM